MTLLADRDATDEHAVSTVPEQGVIEEARRRRRARVLRWSAVGLAAFVALVALVLGGVWGGSDALPPLRLPPEPPRIPPSRLAATAPDGVAVRVTPSLEGAEAGWDVQIIQRDMMSATSGFLATPSNPIVSGGTGWSNGEPNETTVVVTAPDVARVRFANGRSAATVTQPALPYGLRVAVLRTPRQRGTPNRFTAIRIAGFENASGQPIQEGAIRGSGLSWRIWNPPAKPSPGACALRASGAYSTEWGQVAAKIGPYPAPIYGRGFLSCIDTEYFPAGCHSPGCGLRAAVILDAARPGRVAPAPIPGLAPIRGLPGYANSAQNYGFGQLSARRVGDAWIVAVAQGNHTEQARIRLLRDLAVTITRH